MPPTPPQRPRETLPDALRALALISVLVVNAIGYAAAPWGPTLGFRTPPDSAWASLTQGAVAAVLHGKGYTTLAFVFGMALWLAARHRPRAEALQRGQRRQRRLLQVGIFHGVFLYFGDILTLYALVGRPLLRRLHRPWGALRRHFWHALAWAVLAKLVLLALTLMAAESPARADTPALSTVQGAWAFFQLNAGFYAAIQVVALLVGGPVMYLCMLGGVAAARLRLLTHRRWRPLWRRGLWLAGPPLLVLSVAHGWAWAVHDPAADIDPWIEALGDLIALPVAACYLAIAVLASDGGRARWCAVLAPLGQRTLSLYVGHSALCLLLLSGAGWALAPTTLQTVVACLGLWLLALAGARLSGRRRWPLEAWLARR
ncbi:MAG: DUF418 domain-containing protein [Hydrogenophaga sp.]|uniref:DUF418 domain-containing protein n=1 Tax=Hydrogenophaga sp. TaxID=1904254 RepID=UPI002632D262|nr:DUF418 domain-containing protein [Hydrogenophaga sp.]MCW5669311.1 DUF418 domain-containing protein [Hydrogenophaga sp.]